MNQDSGFSARNSTLSPDRGGALPLNRVSGRMRCYEGGKQTIAQAVLTSSGGAPTILVAEDGTLGIDEGK